MAYPPSLHSPLLDASRSLFSSVEVHRDADKMAKGLIPMSHCHLEALGLMLGVDNGSSKRQQYKKAE